MQLQLAFDGGLEASLTILQRVRPFIDIAEIGTPLVFREGMAAARRLRQAFADLPLLADLKIMDAGDIEATIAFEAGCDLVTVLGVTQDATIQGALAAAARAGKQVMVDMMQVNNLPDRARQLWSMGCHFLCVHTAYDLQMVNHSPLAPLQQVRQALPAASLAVAGGITLANLDAVLALQPQIIVVGGAITRASDPVQVARTLYARIHNT